VRRDGGQYRAQRAQQQGLHLFMTLRDFAIKYGFIALLVGLIVFFTLATDGFGSPQAAVFIFQSVAIERPSVGMRCRPTSRNIMPSVASRSGTRM
jgi:hypothetical protein